MEMVLAAIFLGVSGMLMLPFFKWLDERQTRLKLA